MYWSMKIIGVPETSFTGAAASLSAGQTAHKLLFREIVDEIDLVPGCLIADADRFCRLGDGPEFLDSGEEVDVIGAEKLAAFPVQPEVAVHA